MGGKGSACRGTAPVMQGVVLAPVSGMLMGMEGQVERQRLSICAC